VYRKAAIHGRPHIDDLIPQLYWFRLWLDSERTSYGYRTTI
jgi:hypothetical protein